MDTLLLRLSNLEILDIKIKFKKLFHRWIPEKQSIDFYFLSLSSDFDRRRSLVPGCTKALLSFFPNISWNSCFF